MLIKRRWHVTWTCTDSSRTRSLSIPVRHARLLLALAGVALLLLGGASIWLLFNDVSNAEMASLEEENELLQGSVADLATQIDSVQVRLELMEDWEERVRRDDNLRQLDEVLLDDPLSGSYTPGYIPPPDEMDETESGI